MFYTCSIDISNSILCIKRRERYLPLENQNILIASGKRKDMIEVENKNKRYKTHKKKQIGTNMDREERLRNVKIHLLFWCVFCVRVCVLYLKVCLLCDVRMCEWLLLGIHSVLSFGRVFKYRWALFNVRPQCGHFDR